MISNETYFFRDQGQFDLLRLRLLPELIERHREEKILRLWSAGCSSGEEAYSLAILIDVLLPKREDWKIFILGSDINPDLLEKAQQGRYRKWSFRMAPSTLQRRYFRQLNDEWLLDEQIRQMVTFRELDLIQKSFPNNNLRCMDLILCRNVFIYFPVETVAIVAEKIANTLNEGGYLMTGHTELMGHCLPQLESKLFPDGLVYQRRSVLKKAFVPEKTKPFHIEQKALKPISSTVTLLPTDKLAIAHELANRGEYAQAEQLCHQVLVSTPLAIEPYFLLAQLAQLQGNFEQARELLEKILYLNPHHVAAHLELAALYERIENLPQAQKLRNLALGILHTLPPEMVIDPYETTVKDICLFIDNV